MSAGVVVSAPVAGSAVTTARTRPPRRPRTGRAPLGSPRRPTTTARPRSTPAACSRSAARAVTMPARSIARADRMDLGGAGRDDDLARMDVEHARAASGRRSSARRRSRRPPRRRRRRGRGRTCPARSASAAAASPLDPPPMTATSTSRWCSSTVDRERRGRQVRGGHHGERRHRPGRMPRDPQPGPRRGLARPDVGDAVDLGEAVAAIAGQAQRPAAPGDLAAAQDRDRDRVARLERDRPPVDDDPPAARRAALGGRRRDLGHWRIRRPSGSNSGSGWSRAGRRRPMISISKPSPPGPSGVGERRRHVPQRDRLPDVVAVAART